MAQPADLGRDKIAIRDCLISGNDGGNQRGTLRPSADVRQSTPDRSGSEIRKPGQKSRPEKLEVSDIAGEFLEPALSLGDFYFKLVKQTVVALVSGQVFVSIIAQRHRCARQYVIQSAD